jgi:dihydrofolate synthase/folylpolyglutamate synthase
LGGRFDATNVLKQPVAVGITNVSLDHVHILGDTVEKIAFEKAGIIKPLCPVVTGARDEAFEVIRRRASEQNAPLLHIENNHATVCNGETASAPFEKDLIETTEFSGDYQSLNSQIAIALLYVSNYLAAPAQIMRAQLPVVTRAHVREGLQKTYWPGRLQWIASQKLLLDGAHNTAGIKALREVLDQRYPDQPLRFVFGCYANKDGMGMMQNLLRRNDIVYVSEAFSRRVTYDRAALAEHALKLGVTASVYESVSAALEAAKAERQEDEVIVATGSFATVKEVALTLGWQTVEDALLVR